ATSMRPKDVSSRRHNGAFSRMSARATNSCLSTVHSMPGRCTTARAHNRWTAYRRRAYAVTVPASEWIHTKRTVHSRDGMVTARSPLAAAAGAEMLRAGGNALDAAAAAILATGVVHPFATGLGGGGLMTICQPGKPGRTLDYRSEASRRASCD